MLQAEQDRDAAPENAKSIPAGNCATIAMMRILLILFGAASLLLPGCTTLDQNAAATEPVMAGADASIKPGSGPGLQSTNGMVRPNTGPY